MHGMMERKARSTRLLSLDSTRTFFCVTDRRLRDAMLIIAKTGGISRHVKLIIRSQARRAEDASLCCLEIFVSCFFLSFFYFISFNGDDKVIVHYVVDWQQSD